MIRDMDVERSSPEAVEDGNFSPVLPHPNGPQHWREFSATDHEGRTQTVKAVSERALTVWLNRQEIVTLMTICDHPRWLALGYLYNQGMILSSDCITGIDYEEEISVVVVRTRRETDYESRLARRVQTSGCGSGTAFGDLASVIARIWLPEQTRMSISDMFSLLKDINTKHSLYLEVGAVHGCVLASGSAISYFAEDVGRHNAVDTIAGWIQCGTVNPANCVLYTTGRLTSEMIIKTIQMNIPILISRSGYTAWAIELAHSSNLTMIARARGQRYLVLSGAQRLDGIPEPA